MTPAVESFDPDEEPPTVEEELAALTADLTCHSLGSMAEVADLTDAQLFGRALVAITHAFEEHPDGDDLLAAWRAGVLEVRFTVGGMTLARLDGAPA